MDGEVYHSFSTGVPEAIANVLRVGVENFQQQHDPIFWLSLSPAEVSKRLNEIADLQVMDDSIRKSLAIKKEAQHRLKFCKEQRKAAKKRCGELAYVPEMSNAIRTLQALAENIDEQRSSLARLISLCASVETNTEKAAKLETAVLGAQKLAEAETVIEHKKASLRLLRKALDDAKRYASIPEIDLDDEFKQLQATKDKQKRLYELISTIEDNEREIAQCSKLLRNLQDSANIPMCPTCGRPIQPSQK
jgi:DNA repair exonuclease SbcCD ATPase subunit